MKKIIAVFCILSIAYTAQAADDVFQLNSLPKVLSNVSSVLGDAKGELFQNFIKELDRNQSTFEALDFPVSLAEKITLNFNANEYNDNSWDLQSKNLIISVSDCNQSPMKDKIDYLPIALHEFGHSVFDANILNLLASEFSATSDNLKQQAILIINGKMDEASKIQVSTSITSLPFHELFADSVAVLILNNPKAISEQLTMCKGVPSSRDFSQEFDSNTWNVGKLGGALDRRHEVLNPVRSHIWKVFVDKFHQDDKSVVIILKALINASVKVLKEINDNRLTTGEWEIVSQSELNLKLIQNFDLLVGQ